MEVDVESPHLSGLGIKVTRPLTGKDPVPKDLLQLLSVDAHDFESSGNESTSIFTGVFFRNIKLIVW
jgi:hypothetical protein